MRERELGLTMDEEELCFITVKSLWPVVCNVIPIIQKNTR